MIKAMMHYVIALVVFALGLWLWLVVSLAGLGEVLSMGGAAR